MCDVVSGVRCGRTLADASHNLKIAARVQWEAAYDALVKEGREAMSADIFDRKFWLNDDPREKLDREERERFEEEAQRSRSHPEPPHYGTSPVEAFARVQAMYNYPSPADPPEVGLEELVNWAVAHASDNWQWTFEKFLKLYKVSRR